MKKSNALFFAVFLAFATLISSCSPYHCNGNWRGGTPSGRNVFGPKRTSLKAPVQQQPVKTAEIKL